MIEKRVRILAVIIAALFFVMLYSHHENNTKAQLDDLNIELAVLKNLEFQYEDSVNKLSGLLSKNIETIKLQLAESGIVGYIGYEIAPVKIFKRETVKQLYVDSKINTVFYKHLGEGMYEKYNYQGAFDELEQMLKAPSVRDDNLYSTRDVASLHSRDIGLRYIATKLVRDKGFVSGRVHEIHANVCFRYSCSDDISKVVAGIITDVMGKTALSDQYFDKVVDLQIRRTQAKIQEVKG